MAVEYPHRTHVTTEMHCHIAAQLCTVCAARKPELDAALRDALVMTSPDPVVAVVTRDDLAELNNLVWLAGSLANTYPDCSHDDLFERLTRWSLRIERRGGA